MDYLRGDKMERWREEVEFDPEAMERIVNIVDHYPMSLRDCARIVEAAALLCQYKTSNGVIMELNRLTEQYGLR